MYVYCNFRNYTRWVDVLFCNFFYIFCFTFVYIDVMSNFRLNGGCLLNTQSGGSIVSETCLHETRSRVSVRFRASVNIFALSLASAAVHCGFNNPTLTTFNYISGSVIISGQIRSKLFAYAIFLVEFHIPITWITISYFLFIRYIISELACKLLDWH